MKSNPRIFNVVLAGIMVLTALLGTTVPAKAIDVEPTLDLFISEYVEGSSYNKAIEIYNPTSSAIDLAAGNYVLEMYTNGSPTVSTTYTLAGTIVSGDVFTLVDNRAEEALLLLADQVTTTTYIFNGDDALVLKKDGTILDVIGQIGTDPGTQWGTGDITTLDHTLQRMDSVCAGDIDGSDAFDPSLEWNGFPINTYTGLGSHTANCGSSDPVIIINEVDADTPSTDVLEFIELFDGGVGNTSLDGLVVVLYNGGSTDSSYAAYDLDGYSTNENGYFVLGNSGVTPTPDYIFPNGTLQNGEDAVALYEDDASSFSNGTAITTTNLLDAIVYDTSDADDAELLVLLNMDQPQVDENSNANGAFVSNQRCPNGEGGQRNTDTYDQNLPTPGAENSCNKPIIATCSAVSLEPGQSGTGAFSAIDEDGIVISGEIISDPVTGISLGTVTPATQVNEALTGEINLDNLAEGTYSVELSFANDDDPAQTATCNLLVTVAPPPGICDGDTHEIGAIQGTGSATPFSGQTVTISGIVTDVYQGTDEIGGFFVQDSTGDGNDLTSDGIYVYSSTAVSTGEIIQVTGQVSEYFENTQISSATVNPCTPISDEIPTTITPTELTLPVTSFDDFEKLEGMLVTFTQDLTISEYYEYGRYNQIVLTPSRILNPTAIYEPGSTEALNAIADYDLYRIFWDDARSIQNPEYNIHPNGAEFTLDNLFRGGDQLSNVTGVIYYSYNEYRLNTPTADFVNTNPRSATHDQVGGTLKIASFNVLNYFTSLGSRGAESIEEFTRQRAKIIAAIVAIDADVVGLIEIENNTEAIADLVSGLNDVMGAGTYAYVDTGVIGTDDIKVAFIYKPATVSLVGDYAILDSSEDSRFIDTKNRPMLTQTFEEISSGEVFTVAVNHLKSKSSDCNDLGDPDTGDGSGNCNLTRTAAAEAIVDWLATDPTDSNDPDFLIIGDLNSYDKETPIDAILEGADDILGNSDDYVDLVNNYLGENAYSYVFDGRVGYLDHALSNQDLFSQVTGTTIWHINSDEPSVLDYNLNYKPDGQIALYNEDPYRSSDHDPVIIGLDLGNQTPVAHGQTVSVDEDGSIDITLVGSDTETADDDLLFAIDQQPEHGTVTLVDNIATYEPDENYNGSDSFTFTVNDGEEDSAPATVSITVDPVNDAPVAVADSGESYSVVADQVLTMTAPGVLGNDSDADGDTLEAVLVTDVTHGTLTLNAVGSFTYDPDDSFVGVDTFTYYATDGDLNSNVVTVTITVIEIPVTGGYVIYMPFISKN